MLKQTVEYTDFDDNKATETLYFNLTKSELTENLHLKEELEGLQKMVTGERRELETSEVTQILELVKTFMRLSYGVRSSDGKRFIKTPELWTEFTQTAVYDAFLFSLFEDPTRAVNFMSGILPLDLRERARAAAEKDMKAAGLEIAKTEPAKPEVALPAAEDKPSPEELEQAVKWLRENPKL